MPQIQQIDTTPRKPEPTGVQEFFSNLSTAYKDKSDQDTIGNILKEVKENEFEVRAIQDAQLKLESSDVSPSKRLSAQNTLNSMQKNTTEREKALNARVKNQMDTQEKQQKVEKDQKESETILLENDYTPEEASELSKTLSPAEARKEVGKERPGSIFAKKREEAVLNYYSETIKSGDASEETQFAIDQARNAIQGQVAGPGMEAVLKNNQYSKLLMGLTPDEALLSAANKKLLEGTKGLFGPKPTEREIFILLNDMLPAIGKTKEANMAGLDFIEKINLMKLMKRDIVEKLTEDGTKYVPNLEKLVSDEMAPLTKALREELNEAHKKYVNPQDKDQVKEKNSETLKVRAPDGSLWEMTQEQIDTAKKKKGVIFERT